MTRNLFVSTTVYHASVLSTLHQRVFPAFWTEQSFYALLMVPSSQGLIAHTDEKPVGFVLGQTVVDEAEILTVAVDPIYQNQGWGFRLLTAFKKDLINKGIKKISLEVAVNNEKAIYLYEKLGFLIGGRRPLYYAQGGNKKEAEWVDALIMTSTFK